MQVTRTILIVDDSARMRDAIVRCCTRPEDTIIEASNGREAVEHFLRHQPDWTIMDVQMPQMNGFTATREILRQFSAARVIILTQHDSPDYREEARAAGACAFVSKDELSRLSLILQPNASQTGGNPQSINP